MSEPAKPTKPIAVLLADVDGTLVTEQKILTERAVKAVQALRQKGIKFAITSGRPPRGMDMLIEPLALDTPIAGFNGGAMVKPDGTVIDEKTLPPDIARETIALIDKHKMDAWLYTAKDWFVRDRKAPHCDREAWTVKFEPVVVDTFKDEDLDKAVKIVGVSDDLDLVAQCEKDAQEAFGDKVSAARSQPYYLDVTHPHANKGDVVETLSKTLNVPKDQFATIGDMPNDVNMFKKSGFSIAMGQASDAVKKQASATTASYNDEGFAKAVEDYLLKGGAVMSGSHDVLIAPSILSADFGHLAREIEAVDRGGADWIHVDVMDGRFVPNITFGPALVEAARRATKLPLNLHLMIVEPERMIDDFVKAGADHLVIQAEPAATIHPHRVLGRIRDLGKQAGVALNPGSPLALIEELLPLCDIVIIMTVNPGFGGQAFLPDTMDKLRRLRLMCADRGLDPRVMVDGGIAVKTAPIAVAAGADVLVAGSSVFGAEDYGRAIADIRASTLVSA